MYDPATYFSSAKRCEWKGWLEGSLNFLYAAWRQLEWTLCQAEKCDYRYCDCVRIQFWAGGEGSRFKTNACKAGSYIRLWDVCTKLHEASRRHQKHPLLDKTHRARTLKLRSLQTAKECPRTLFNASDWLVWTSARCWRHVAALQTQPTSILSSTPFLSRLSASIISCRV